MMIIMIIIIIIIIEKSFHANFRSYGSRARFELRESRAAGLFREETRRSVRRREERQRGGEGEGGNSISARTSANSHSVVIVYDDDECANNDALVSLPARSWEQFAPAIRPAFRPFEKQGTNFFLPSPFVWEKKKKGKGGEREREGRKEGETNFSNDDRRPLHFSMWRRRCVSVSSSINGSWPAIDLAGE